MFSSQNNDVILSLYRDKRTVFRLSDVAMLTGDTDRISLSKKLNYYVRTGKLNNPRKGIYTKPDYSARELACRLYTPSYISLETVLASEGVIFQYDSSITIVSYLSRTLEINEQTLRYRKIKNACLLNTRGIIRQTEGINIATPERALLDMLYLNPGYYFDNINAVDKEKTLSLVEIYDSKTLQTTIHNLFSYG